MICQSGEREAALTTFVPVGSRSRIRKRSFFDGSGFVSLGEGLGEEGDEGGCREARAARVVASRGSGSEVKM